jgi:dTDP-4-dehydrorhamnose reductase
MNVLVLGENGQLACCLKQRLPGARFFGRARLDLEDCAAIRPALLAERPDVIVNAAAYTAVDAAEDDRERAWRINAEAVGEIAAAAAELGVPVLHVSTDYVFAGDTTQSYREDSPVAPVNAYGASKLDGERALAECAGPAWWILRTSSVFSEFGHNFVKTMLRLAGTGQPLRVVADQVSRPTYAGDVADVVVCVLRSFADGNGPVSGIYHCASTGAASWYELAQTSVVRAADLGLLDAIPALEPIPSRDYPTRAARPAHSVLDTARIEAALDWRLPHWREGLDTTLIALRG